MINNGKVYSFNIFKSADTEKIINAPAAPIKKLLKQTSAFERKMRKQQKSVKKAQ